MSDYIKREDVLAVLEKHKCDSARMETAIRNLTTTYGAAVKDGEWLGSSLYPYWKCSVCDSTAHYQHIISGWRKYCHNCGAKMKRRMG